VLTKYATAPLFVYDLLHSWLSRRRISAYLPAAAVAVIISVALAAPFFHSRDALSATSNEGGYHVYTPDVGVWALEEMTTHVGWLRRAVRLSFPFIAVLAMVRYLQTQDETRFLMAILSVLAAILFSVIGHAWPWYFVLLLGVAALVPASAMTRWVIGVCLVAPFVILPRTIAPLASDFMKYQLPSLVMYVIALTWFFFVPRRWLAEGVDTRPNAVRTDQMPAATATP
jgi:hypothetical protein